MTSTTKEMADVEISKKAQAVAAAAAENNKRKKVD